MDWSRFDTVIMQDYTGYTDRRTGTDAALANVGLSGEVIRRWQFPSPFDDRLLACLNRNRCVTDVGTFSCTMGHYSILKTAYELGISHVLVLEDDIRFLRDHVLLQTIIDGLPGDYDFAKFEWYPRGSESASYFEKVKSSSPDGSFWAVLPSSERTCGAGMSAYSREGMKWKIDLIEKAVDFRNEIRSIDTYDGFGLIPNGLHVYVSIPVAAVQGVTSGPRIHKAYKPYGVFLHGGSRDSYDLVDCS